MRFISELQQLSKNLCTFHPLPHQHAVAVAYSYPGKSEDPEVRSRASRLEVGQSNDLCLDLSPDVSVRIRSLL